MTHLGKTFIRGSNVRYVITPDMLKNAPMFKRLDPKMKVSVRGAGGRERTQSCPSMKRLLSVLSLVSWLTFLFTLCNFTTFRASFKLVEEALSMYLLAAGEEVGEEEGGEEGDFEIEKDWNKMDYSTVYKRSRKIQVT